MNFLAHQYLSGADEQIKIGNFIADLLRGKEVDAYKGNIRLGIDLHRQIDQFTDDHPAVKEAVKIFKETQGKYAPVIVDIAFDHFLAANWQKYHQQELNDFAMDFYEIMTKHQALLPEKVQFILPRMRTQNWLYEYQYLDGIQKAFEGVSRRASFASNMANARIGLERNYDELQFQFDTFFEDIITFVKEQNIKL